MRLSYSHRAILVTVIAAGVLGGCSDTQAGTPRATGISATTPPSSSSSPPDVFNGMNACDVLNQLLASQSFEPGKNISQRNECVASKIRYGSASIALDPAQGLAEFRKTDPNASELTINGRPALEAVESFGGCAIALEVSSTARAVAGIALEDPRNDSCPDSRRLAEKLEPLLPKVQ
ncbi:DUF3558 family protein [Amycolatopsis suaedae]|uniref:DUF3558 domain-containing protein n=1 Tax=Amycolatopsis suaedae TaxID=2510978 RepID=A0A4Q7J084_9PSEU|nr:DUF3558 family protein [Amycolatopsis suaedae]RZQ60741.1 DUF3558 domain-containing protein [Amycolatopsis suaedae]